MAVNRLAILFSQEDDILSRQIKELTNDLTVNILVVERVGGYMPLNLSASLVQGFFDDFSLSIVKDIDRMAAFLEIAQSQNGERIKPVNFEILINEYQKLRNEMFSQAPAMVRPIRDFQSRNVEEGGNQINGVERPEKRTVVQFKKPYFRKLAKKTVAKRDLSPRQKKLLDAIKKNGEARMSDFLGVFKNEVTERTLRNDLRDLVGVGAIRTEGEFKTRKYYIR